MSRPELLQTLAACWILATPAVILLTLAGLLTVRLCLVAADVARRAHWNHDELPENPPADYLRLDRLEPNDDDQP